MCALTLGLVLLGGCRTAKQAQVAAGDLVATAKASVAFYGELDVVLHRTGQVYVLNAALYGKPYTAENRALLERNERRAESRVRFAEALEGTAEGFAALTAGGSAAGTEAAAVNLLTAAEGLGGAAPSAGATTEVTVAARALVAAVQAHKVREAARAMEGVTRGASEVFRAERPAWASVETGYTGLSATLAGNLLGDGAVETAGLLDGVLAPFGLRAATPLGAGTGSGMGAGLGGVSGGGSGDGSGGGSGVGMSAGMRAALVPVAQAQIADRRAAMDAQYGDAAAALEAALARTVEEVQAVAGGRARPRGEAGTGGAGVTATRAQTAVDGWVKVVGGR